MVHQPGGALRQTLCVHVSDLVVRLLDASLHQHLVGDRHPDRVVGTVNVRTLARSVRPLLTETWVRIPLYPVAVAVLWRPTFKEPLSAMT